MQEMFSTFSVPHIVVLLITISLCIFTPLLGWYFKRGSLVDQILRWGIALFLLINELIFYGVILLSGLWDVKTTMPLFLCDILVFICSAALLFPKRLIFLSELTYFWALGATLQALLTPAFEGYFPSYFFFKFFSTHGLVIVGALYLVGVCGVRPNFKSAFKAFIATNIWALFVGIFNVVFHTNYMFLMSKPSQPSILDYFGPWPIYILTGEIFAIGIYLLLALPFEWKRIASRM